MSVFPRNVCVSRKLWFVEDTLLKWIGWRLRQIGTSWNLVQVLNPSVLTRRGGRAMTRQWRKEKKSDLAKPGFSLAYAHYLTLIFHTLCRGGVLLSGVRTSFFLNNLRVRHLAFWNSDYSGGTIIYASTPSMDEQCPLCVLTLLNWKQKKPILFKVAPTGNRHMNM